MQATIWSLLPPVLAIITSLLTKEVNISLLVGIISGCGIYCGFNPFTTITTLFDIMSDKVYGNLGVIYFIILLGMIVHLMNLSGATHEYARWASKKLHTKKQAALVTMLLGMLIFVDDYFNCLTVGTVMRPITDRNRISREKLAYIIDSTGAPICVIAPISSWAAAISSSLPDGSTIDGFQLFVKSIFCNYYSLVSLGLVFLTIVLNVDFGKMRAYEKAVEAKAVARAAAIMEEEVPDSTHHGKVIDLILPVLAIIVFSIISMLYTGDYFKGGVSIQEAFMNCDAILGLAMGIAYAVIFVALLYLPRGIVTFKEFLDGLVQGFIDMVPATFILTFAWTLSGVCGGSYLNAGGFVAKVVNQYSIPLNMMPAIFFVIALMLAFSVGTSWGTFAILLPITISVFGDQMGPLVPIATAAVLGGAVCGDHVSPISDTTILSSTGAGCNHLNHVSSQMQYGGLAAVISICAYIISGITENSVLGILVSVGLLLISVFAIKMYYQVKEGK